MNESKWRADKAVTRSGHPHETVYEPSDPVDPYLRVLQTGCKWEVWAKDKLVRPSVADPCAAANYPDLDDYVDIGSTGMGGREPLPC